MLEKPFSFLMLSRFQSSSGVPGRPDGDAGRLEDGEQHAVAAGLRARVLRLAGAVHRGQRQPGGRAHRHDDQARNHLQDRRAKREGIRPRHSSQVAPR